MKKQFGYFNLHLSIRFFCQRYFFFVAASPRRSNSEHLRLKEPSKTEANRKITEQKIVSSIRRGWKTRLLRTRLQSYFETRISYFRKSSGENRCYRNYEMPGAACGVQISAPPANHTPPPSSTPPNPKSLLYMDYRSVRRALRITIPIQNTGG